MVICPSGLQCSFRLALLRPPHPVKNLTAGIAQIPHRSLNDDSVEGLVAPSLRAFSLQYHPEAAPGPHDASPSFTTFLCTIRG